MTSFERVAVLEARSLNTPTATITFMEAKLLLVPWIVAVVYSSIPPFWFVIHPFAARWRRMKRSPYRALLPLWAVMILAIAAITWPWRQLQIYDLPWMWIPGALILLCGLATYRKVLTEFGGHKFSGEAELRPDEHSQNLVSSGLHSRMRHPIYFAHLCNLAGWAVGSGLVVCFVLLGINVLVTFPLMIWMEERELERRFGEQYKIYQATVPALPFMRLLKPDPTKSARRLFESLLTEIPHGAARLELQGEHNVVLVPANPSSATIWGSGGDGQYIISAGNGCYHEHFERSEEVLAFCRWVIAGNLEETLWMKGDRVIASSGTGGNETHLLWGFNPFQKKSKVYRKYPPYTAAAEGELEI